MLSGALSKARRSSGSRGNQLCDSSSAAAEESFGAAGDKHHVVVPDGLKPGDALRVKLPGGKKVELTIPAGVKPGDTIEVEETKVVKVAVPRTAKAGDTLQAEVEGGATIAFTVPAGTKPGATIKVSVPVSQLSRRSSQSTDGGTDEVDVTSVHRTLPAHWDGMSPITTDVDGRPIIFQPPAGARPGEDVTLDVPAASAKVRLTFNVPINARGGDIVQIRTPSRHLKCVHLPPEAAPGAQLTVRIADEPDDASPPTAGGTARGTGPRTALLARGRSLSGEALARSGPRRATPVFIELPVQKGGSNAEMFKV